MSERVTEELRAALSWLAAAAERDIERRSRWHNDGGENLREALDNALDLLDAEQS